MIQEIRRKRKKLLDHPPFLDGGNATIGELVTGFAGCLEWSAQVRLLYQWEAELENRSDAITEGKEADDGALQDTKNAGTGHEENPGPA